MKETYIYKISDENGNVRYIGKSNNPRRRLYQHTNDRHNLHKFNWLRSIINRGHKPVLEIVEKVSVLLWKEREIYWIAKYREDGHMLLNMTIGGDGAEGMKHSEESRKKMSQSKKGLKLSDEHKQKISQSLLDKSLDPNYVKFQPRVWSFQKDDLYQKYIVEDLSIPKLSEYYNCSEKTIFTNLKENCILKDKEVWKKQCAENTKKSVLQFDLGGQLLKEWESVREPSDFYQNTNIAACCRGEAVTAVGFIWRYRNEFKEIDLDRLNYQKRKVSQYDLQGNFIKSFESIKDAASYEFDESNIQDCCVGRLKSSKGYIWRYSEDSPPEKYRNKTIKSVFQYTLTGNLIKEWYSISQASKELAIGSNSITTCCKGKYKSAGGFIWKYKDDI
jgi:hypothetical protein